MNHPAGYKKSVPKSQDHSELKYFHATHKYSLWHTINFSFYKIDYVAQSQYRPNNTSLMIQMPLHHVTGLINYRLTAALLIYTNVIVTYNRLHNTV